MSKRIVFALHLPQTGQQIKARGSNLTRPVRLHVVSGCFFSLTAELDCCDEDYMLSKG